MVWFCPFLNVGHEPAGNAHPVKRAIMLFLHRLFEQPFPPPPGRHWASCSGLGWPTSLSEFKRIRTRNSGGLCHHWVTGFAAELLSELCKNTVSGTDFTVRQLLRSSGDGRGKGHTAGSLFLLSGRMLELRRSCRSPPPRIFFSGLAACAPEDGTKHPRMMACSCGIPP